MTHGIFYVFCLINVDYINIISRIIIMDKQNNDSIFRGAEVIA